MKLTRTNFSWWLIAVVVAGVALGIALRTWIVDSPLGPPDSDEAVVGLMGKHMLDGEFRSFYWGQPYGGAQEPAEVALLLAVSVPMRAAMELAPIIASAIIALLVWRIGRRLINPTAGVLAGVLVWATPSAYVWQTTKERGFYGATIIAGLVVVLFAARLLERPTIPDALVLGVAGGTGWYANPQIVFFAVPALAWLGLSVIRRRDVLFKLLRLAPVAIAGAVLGALPWIYTNLQSNFASLHKNDVPPSTFLERFDLFFRVAFPNMLGIRTPHHPTYWPWGVLSKVLYVAVVALLVLACLRLPRPALVIPLAIAMYPLIFAAFPTSWYVNEPRYVYCLAPWMALAVGGGLASIPTTAWGKAARSAALVAIGVLTIVATGALINVGRTVGGLWDLAAGDLDPLLVELERDGPSRLYADYWVAQRITLETDETIVAAPVNFPRYQAYEEMVRDDPAPGFVVFPGSCYDNALQAYFAATGLPHTRQIYGGIYTLYRTPAKVRPEDVLVDWATVRGKGDRYAC
ncbi:MAG: glycosyltransferase family 39 protein [Acidimicrobiales bacterium]